MVLVFHPAKERPKVAAGLAFGLGILLQMLWQWLNPVPALVIWCVLVVSLRDFYLPSTYEMSAEGLMVQRVFGTKRYPWERFRSYVKDRNGLFLSPYRTRRATENQRGLFLPLRSAQRDEAVEFCHEVGLERRDK
jgi:hypothetical protein